MAAKKKKRLTKAQAEALRKKRSKAAKRAWAERKAKTKRRSEAAKKAAATRKRNALEAAKKRKPKPKSKPKPKPKPKAKRPTLKEKAEHARQAAEEARLERERKDEADRLERERQAEEIRREAERLERERQEAERRAEREPSPLPPWRDRLIRDFENITYRGRFVEDIEIIPNPDGSVMIFGYVEILGRRVQVQAYQVETETSGSRFWGQLQNTQAGNPVAAFEEGLYEDQDAPDAPDFITGWYDEAFDEDAA